MKIAAPSKTPQLPGLQALVVGGGVVGLAAALELQSAGALVRIVESGAPAPHASAVAAGMLAPAAETMFEPGGERFRPLYDAALDRWADAALRYGGVEVERCGATLVDADAVSHFAATDARLSPSQALAVMREAFASRGGGWLTATFDPAMVQGDEILVLAAGWFGVDLVGLAPELGRLSPIKGHVLHYAGGPADGAIVRSADVYVAPQRTGAIAGATMEPGVSTREIDPALVAGLRSAAERLAPGLRDVPFRALTGVRAATPDALPMAGASSRPGVWLATGARRNGWLLAPLMAEALVAGVAGEDHPCAALFDPRRFEAWPPSA